MPKLVTKPVLGILMAKQIGPGDESTLHGVVTENRPMTMTISTLVRRAKRLLMSRVLKGLPDGG